MPRFEGSAKRPRILTAGSIPGVLKLFFLIISFCLSFIRTLISEDAVNATVGLPQSSVVRSYQFVARIPAAVHFLFSTPVSFFSFLFFLLVFLAM